MWRSTCALGSLMVAFALAGCGGGTSTTTTGIRVGPWSGTYTLGSGSSATNSTIGAISSEDDGYFADNNGYVYVLQSVPGSTPFTATLTGIAPPGQTFSNGQAVMNFSVSGSYSTSSTGMNMQASFTENDGQGSLSGNFTLASTSPFTGTPNISSLQGQWSGYYIGRASTSVNMNFGPDGTFAGSDGYGCLTSGSMSPDAPGTNLYDVDFTSSGANCAGSLSGLAYESTTDVTGAFGGASGTYLYMTVFDSLTAYVIELKD